jgi:hypothetical protein
MERPGGRTVTQPRYASSVTRRGRWTDDEWLASWADSGESGAAPPVAKLEAAGWVRVAEVRD